MKHLNYKTSSSCWNRLTSHTFFIWFSILAILMLVSMACNIGETNIAEAPAASGGGQSGQVATLPGIKCDASQLVSVTGKVEWTLPGVSDRKCREPLVFTLNGSTDETILILVHMIKLKPDYATRWIPDELTMKNPTGSSGIYENWWSSDEQITYPEFIAVYNTLPKYAGCDWVRDNPEESGLKKITVPSSCP